MFAVQQLTYAIILTSSNLISEIRRSFGKLDKNKDNRLSAEEFVRGGKMIIMFTKEEAQKMVDGVDNDDW